ncbi:hypothetical protein BC938DRAFT_483124 [Jimgerdemannia flammicorona]|uniref:TLDc domain-containing protein n=1 Tax=Jimgerdemannia flammicorona TaxID=994334 RepID=A0A433QCI7_9FUNG|nr:hypothetical protein BC938DRAFT_483124 [Jimgerdemannia flammicorona]
MISVTKFDTPPPACYSCFTGIGLGGQMDYFGLWISADFEHGHSRAAPHCTTYASPKLAGKEEFIVDEVEGMYVYAFWDMDRVSDAHYVSSLIFFPHAPGTHSLALPTHTQGSRPSPAKG